VLLSLGSDLKLHLRLPHVRTGTGANIPRTLAFAQGYFGVTEYHFNEQGFASFCLGFQESAPLELKEFKALVPAMELVLLEEISARGARLLNDADSGSHDVGA